MAGSYQHITRKDYGVVDNEEFVIYIENLGDAYEAIHEMWNLIDILAGGDKRKIFEAYLEYLKRIGGDHEFARELGEEKFWNRISK